MPEGFTKALNRPFFNFCPTGNGAWRVRFNWQVDAGPDFQFLLSQGPSVIIRVPGDADLITPEKKILVNQYGDVVTTDTAMTSIVVSNSSSGKEISLRPLQTGSDVYQQQQSGVAYYGVNFVTHAFDFGSSGLGQDLFKITLLPKPEGTFGFPQEILPAYQSAGTLSLITCSAAEEHGALVDLTTLNPAPDETLELNKVSWSVSENSTFVVTGQTEGGSLAFVNDNSSIFFWIFVSCIIGAIFSVSLDRYTKTPDEPHTDPALVVARRIPGDLPSGLDQSPDSRPLPSDERGNIDKSDTQRKRGRHRMRH